MTPTLRSRWSSASARRSSRWASGVSRGGRGEQVESTTEHRQVLVGRDDVDRVRLDAHAVLHLRDLHLGHALEQLGHEPLARRVEVLDDYEGETARLRHMTQKLFQGL